MTISPSIYHALDRVNEERTDVTGTLTAYDRFEARVRELDPVASVDASTEISQWDRRTVSDARLLKRNANETAELDRIRELFTRIIRPQSVADIDETAPLPELIEAELGTEISIALSPPTSSGFTAEMKGAICSAVGRRKVELETMDRALNTEGQSVAAAVERFETTVDYADTVPEPSLLTLEFGALCDRHETLSAHRSRCEAIVRERQETLHGTIHGEQGCSLSHSVLTGYLYRELPTSYPVLSTAVRLTDLCTARERTVRDQLTRRV